VVGESWLLITLVLLIVSLITQQIPFLLVTLLVFLSGLLIRIWSHFALARVTHEHVLSNERAFFGDTVTVEVSVSNRKMLPLPVVEVALEAPEELKVLRGSVLPSSGDPFRINLSSFLSMGWYHKVTRRYQIECSKRGYYTFGPSSIMIRDPFGFTNQEAESTKTDTLLVYPRILSLKELGLPSTEILGERQIRRQLFQDPLRIISSRDYIQGDPLNRIHWKATARRGGLQTRVLESTTTPNLVIFLDVNTMETRFQAPMEGPLESAITVAGSIASHAINAGHNVGLYVNEPYRGTRQPIRLAPSRHPDHLQRILVALAHPQGWPLYAIDRMLTTEGRNLPWGASIVIVTPTPTGPLVGAIRRFKRAGRTVALIQVGNTAGTVVPRDVPTHYVSDAVHRPDAESLEVTAR
jgi:uncharacterized protein (DUF58 family)